VCLSIVDVWATRDKPMASSPFARATAPAGEPNMPESIRLLLSRTAECLDEDTSPIKAQVQAYLQQFAKPATPPPQKPTPEQCRKETQAQLEAATRALRLTEAALARSQEAKAALLQKMRQADERLQVEEEAAAAASARALVGYITNSQALRRTFCAADGLSGLRELLDNSSERVLSPTMDLLLALTAGDADILEAACALGLVPAALRLTGAQHAAHLRLAAANFACLLARTSATTTHMLVACQGIPFFLSLMDEAPQAVEQLELLGAAMSGFWALLYRTATPGWWIRTNQYLRLMAHHGLPQRIVRVLPWALKHATTVAKASSSSSGSISMAGQQQSGSCLPSNSATKSASLSVRGMSHGNRIVPEDIERAAHSERGVKAPLDPGTGTALVESLVNLFAAMTHGDVVVKSRCCHCETINALFGLTEAAAAAAAGAAVITAI